MKLIAILAAAAMPIPAAAASTETRPTPYWASISAAKARMRAGPGANFPATWEYVRTDLPVRVLQVRQEWRKVEDPDGTQGWMRAFLLSDRRTAMVKEVGSILRAAPARGARILWRVEPGVVGRISHCASGWCEFDVHGRAGYVEAARLWGVVPGEEVD